MLARNADQHFSLPNERFADVVIVPNGTLNFDALADWKPQAEFHCKRSRGWVETAGADGGGRFQGMT